MLMYPDIKRSMEGHAFGFLVRIYLIGVVVVAESSKVHFLVRLLLPSRTQVEFRELSESVLTTSRRLL